MKVYAYAYCEIEVRIDQPWDGKTTADEFYKSARDEAESKIAIALQNHGGIFRNGSVHVKAVISTK